MKFGIYVTPGVSKQAVAKKTQIEGTSYTADQIAEPSIAENNYNCKGMVRIDYSKPGAQAFINSWVNMLASWDVDYIKIDGMSNDNVPDIKAWSEAIRQSGRPMVLDVTQGSYTQAIAPTLMKYANQWEFAPDVECYGCEKKGSSYPLTSWKDVAKRFNYVADWQPYAGPGGFNDYDSIEVGNGDNNGITPVERQTQLSLWALGASPLLLGVDLTHLDSLDLQYLKNTAVLAVDQDSIAAKRVVNDGSRQVFAKKEANGDVIVGLFNTASHAQTVSVAASSRRACSEGRRLLAGKSLDRQDGKIGHHHPCQSSVAWGRSISRSVKGRAASRVFRGFDLSRVAVVLDFSLRLQQRMPQKNNSLRIAGCCCSSLSRKVFD